MSSELKFTALYGALTDDPPCYVLESDGLVLLLDCGWTDSLDVALLEPLREWAPRIDAVLLSHSDITHLGALPYAFAHFGLDAPIISTGPVHKMGLMFLYDLVTSLQAATDAPAITLDDVDAAFDRFHTVKYAQPHPLGQGLTVTAHAAGRTLGGAIWVLETASGEDLLYAVDWNHSQDRFLPGASISALNSRPALMITDAQSQAKVSVDRAARDQQLLDAVLATLRRGGNVLIPTDTAARCLELILLLHTAWGDPRAGLGVYSLHLATHTGYNTLQFASTSLQWMNDAVLAAFLSETSEASRGGRGRGGAGGAANPFTLPHLQLCQSDADLAALAAGRGRVVLASAASLQQGMARALVAAWGGDPRNLVLLTERCGAGTLAAEVAAATQGARIHLTLSRRVPLEGAELAAHLAAARERDSEPHSDAAMLPAVRESSASVLRLGEVGAVPSTSAAAGHVGAAAPEAPTAAPTWDVLEDGFTAPPGAAGPLFPMEEEDKAQEWTPYGAAIDRAAFSRPGELDGPWEPDEGAGAASGPEVPTKAVAEPQELLWAAAVLQLDFEGRTDARSQCHILGSIAPRQLLLVRGQPEATLKLAEACREELVSLRCEVLTPTPLHTQLLGPSVRAYGVTLHPQLAQSMQLREVGSLQLGWLDAVHGPPREGGDTATLQPNSDNPEATQGGIFVGDVRLSQLKKALADAGLSSEFQSGVLVCKGGVCVRTVGSSGGLLLEGAVSDDFYRIRSLVYAQYHIC